MIDWFKDKTSLINENIKIKRNKKIVEEKYNQLLESNAELSQKYVALLEEKSKQFDLYVKYQNQCEELSKAKRELKKQNAELQEQNTKLSVEKDKLITDKNRLLKKTIKVKTANLSVALKN